MRRPGENEEPKSWRKFAHWPAFLLANVAILVLIGVSTVRETYRGWSVDKEIIALEAQAASLESGKIQLEALAKELVSPDHVEYEARARLGRKRPGERVIVLEGVSTSATWSNLESSEILTAEKVSLEAAGNPARWWAYFFEK